ncbi:MAG: DEAD/DEAH box helicase [Opitutales bacterium]|nr:DEAD/DEAH box helicase [Opitutales bacterium]
MQQEPPNLIDLLDELRPNILFSVCGPVDLPHALRAGRNSIKGFSWGTGGRTLHVHFTTRDEVVIKPGPGEELRWFLNGSEQRPGDFHPMTAGALAVLLTLRQKARFFQPDLPPEKVAAWNQQLEREAPPEPEHHISEKESMEKPTPAPPSPLPKRQKPKTGAVLRLEVKADGSWYVNPHILWGTDRLKAAQEYFTCSEEARRINEAKDFFAALQDVLDEGRIPVEMDCPGEERVTITSTSEPPADYRLALHWDRQADEISLDCQNAGPGGRPGLVLSDEFQVTQGGCLQRGHLPSLAAVLAFLYQIQHNDPDDFGYGSDISYRFLPDAPLRFHRTEFESLWALHGNPLRESDLEQLPLLVDGKETSPLPTQTATTGIAFTRKSPDAPYQVSLFVKTPHRHLEIPEKGFFWPKLYFFRRYNRLFRQEDRREKILNYCLGLTANQTLQERHHQINEIVEKEEDPATPGISSDLREFFRDLSPHLPYAESTYSWVFPCKGDSTKEQAPTFEPVRILSSSLARASFLLAAVQGKADFASALTSRVWDTVREEELPDLLEELLPLTANEGFTVLVDGEEPEIEQIDFALTFREKENEYDWFEVHPEFFHAGRLLEPEDWGDLLQKGSRTKKTKKGLVIQKMTDLEKARKGFEALARGQKKGESHIHRLHLFDWAALRREGLSVELPPKEREIIDSLSNFSGIPPVPLPANLQADLRPYQLEGYHWLAFLYQHRFGGCLADDMGLGKTLQTIALLLALRDGTIPLQGDGKAPHLLILPTSLVFNWQSELEKFAPDLTYFIYRGPGRQPDFAGHDIVLTTYDIARLDANVLCQHPWQVVMLDEAQAVKNEKSRRHQQIRRIQGQFHLCLTGTPVENHPKEFRSIMNLALPGLFGDLEGVSNKWLALHIGLLSTRSAPFVLRRTKKAVLKDLPAKEERTVVLEMDPRQKALYLREAARIRTDIAAAFEQLGSSQAGLLALTAINRLRQLCVHPRLLRPEEKPHSPKTEYLLDTLHQLKEEGHSCLVFSQYTGVLDLLEPLLRKDHLAYLRLDGSTPHKRRQEYVETFQKASGPNVFLISLRAGGVGLNLTKASYVMHLDPWWNPAVENQASDRAHRIGQKRKVLVQKLVMKETVEEKILKLKEKKAQLFADILGKSEEMPASTALQREDFAYLLGD